MAFRINFFKMPQHRVFTYKPIFFDPEKEEREERAAQLRAIREEEMRKKGITPDPETDLRTRTEHYVPGKSVRGSFKRPIYENRRRGSDNPLLRIVSILTIVALLVLLFYFADAIGLLFRAFRLNAP